MHCLFCACGNDKELPTASYSYGPELGLASGNVDLSSDSPDINISDIKSPIGENIDFLSGVTVINEDEYVDLEVWADASTIDIFTPGDYTVTYTFKYSDKSFSKDIKVTIFDPNEGKEPEVSEGASNSLPDENDNNNGDGDGGNDSGNDSDNNGETETTEVIGFVYGNEVDNLKVLNQYTGRLKAVFTLEQTEEKKIKTE